MESRKTSLKLPQPIEVARRSLSSCSGEDRLMENRARPDRWARQDYAIVSLACLWHRHFLWWMTYARHGKTAQKPTRCGEGDVRLFEQLVRLLSSRSMSWLATTSSFSACMVKPHRPFSGLPTSLNFQRVGCMVGVHLTMCQISTWSLRCAANRGEQRRCHRNGPDQLFC